MKPKSIITWLPPGILALLCVSVLTLWLSHDPAADLVLRVPGMDGTPERDHASATVQIGEHFTAGPGIAADDMTGSWTRFRGRDFTNVCTADVALSDRWTDGRPEILWSITVGEGHAGAAVYGGRVYLLDYDEDAGQDALRCLSLRDGEEIWRRSYDLRILRNHGMSRTVPAVTERCVVTLGPKCHVMAADAMSGDLLWTIDLVGEYGARVPMWYTGQCPLIEDGVAILAPAGDNVLMLGVDCRTGEVLWETPNPEQLDMSHSSIVPAVIDGVRMYVYSALGGMVGVGADADNRGEILWFVNAWDRSVMAPSPVVFEDGRIFVTAGYGGGSMVLQVARDSHGRFRADILRTIEPSQGLASEQQTPVVYDGYMFGILPNDAGPHRNQLVCVSPDDITDLIWTSGRENRFGLGPYLIADNKLYVLSDDGVLTMLRPGPEGYRELGRRRIMDGHDAWAPMAIADGLLILRDDTRMVCVDLREDSFR